MTDSMKLVANFVGSARALIPPVYKAENTDLGEFGFVPYVRNGLAAAIATPPAGVALRATIKVSFEVAASDGSGTPKTVSRDLMLYGPGDVVGIDPGQIIRREPVAGTPDAEETFLAHIEFDRPDFPWLFSPKPAVGDGVEPWLALVVVAAGVSAIEPSSNELPARLWTKKGQLQSLVENAQFAHAQAVGVAREANGDLTLGKAGGVQNSVATRLSDAHAPANLARLVCPRKLDPSMRYIAALVPAFDCGVKAGMGMSGGTLGAAWDRAADGSDAADDIVLPVYDHWEFRTAPDGDFRALAAKIKGVAAPWEIGRRKIDMSAPGSGIAALAPDAPGAVQVLECALYSPAPAPAGTVDGDWPVERREALRARVDQGNMMDNPDLPRVGPRLYARFQYGANRLDALVAGGLFADGTAEKADGLWFSQLNTNPALRIVAGLGTRVVQKDQEKLMQAAWAQVEGIRKANQAIIWAQFAEVMNTSAYKRHLEPMELGALAQVTRSVHGKIRDQARARTVYAAVTQSRVADATLTAAFRRATRTGGAVMKRQLRAGGEAASLVTAGAAFRDHRRAYANPDGITGVSAAGLAFFSDAVMAQVLAVDVGQAQGVLAEKLAVLSTKGTAFAQLSAPVQTWKPVAGVKAGDALGGVLMQELGRMTSDRVLAGPDVAAAPVASVLAGIASSGGGLSAAAVEKLNRIGASAPAQSLRFRSAAGRVAEPAAGIGAGAVVRLPGGVAGGFAGFRAVPGAVRPGVNRGPVLIDRGAFEPLRGVPPVADKPVDRFETATSRRVASVIAQMNAAGPQRLLGEFAGIIGGISVPAKPVSAGFGPLQVTKAQLLAELRPDVTARATFKGRIATWPGYLRRDWFDKIGLQPIMAAPVFKRPMYQALDAYDRDWLVPGLGSIAQKDFVTVLKTNAAFSEAFLVGLSDEFGRELLWRDYPTDQRGTYFKRFWDADEDELTAPIHRFSRSAVGRNFSMGGDAAAGGDRLVLVIRGDLVRRYPELIVAAVRQMPGTETAPEFIEDSEAPILFHAHLAPDYVLVGFDLTETQVAAQDWWFLLAEHPTAPRFGLSESGSNATRPAPPGALLKDLLDWDDLTGPAQTLQFERFLAPASRPTGIRDDRSHPKTVNWPGNSAVVARTLLRNPIRAAFRAQKLIASTKPIP